MATLALALLLQDARPAQPEQPRNVLFLERDRIEHGDGTVTVIYYVAHDPQHRVSQLLTRYKSPNGWIHQDESMHLLVIRDTKEACDMMARILLAALSPDPQVKIEVQIIEVRTTERQQVGFLGDAAANSVIWLKSTPTGSFLREIRANLPVTAAVSPSPFIGTSFRFASSHDELGSVAFFLQAFQERGLAKIRSRPVIWVRSGHAATVQSGERVPVPITTIHPGGVNTTIDFRDAGVMLTVTPHVVSRDLVSLEIAPSVTAITGRDVIATSPSGTIVAPSFSTRSLKTEIITRSAEQVVIGGLFREESLTVRRGIPLLMDIPLIGELFSRRESETLTTEIIFVLEPTVYPVIEQIPRGLIRPPR